MTEYETVMPCAAGCLTTDGNVAASAPRSRYCQRCRALAETALTNAAPLVGHLLHQIGGLRSKPGSDGSQRTKGASAPLPFNARAFDDANQVYRLLVGWSLRIAEKGISATSAPVTMAGAWRQGDGRVVGLPYAIDATEARIEVHRIAFWLRGVLPLVLQSEDAEFVAHLQFDLARIQRLNLKWPTEDRPAFSTKAACPDDAGRLLIVPPREPGADRSIVCSKCGRHFTEAEHDRIVAFVAAVARVHRKAVKDAVSAAAIIAKNPPTEPIAVVLG